MEMLEITKHDIHWAKRIEIWKGIRVGIVDQYSCRISLVDVCCAVEELVNVLSRVYILSCTLTHGKLIMSSPNSSVTTWDEA